MTTTEIAEPRSSASRQRRGHDLTHKRDDTARLALLIGGTAVASSVLYLLSDLIEFAQGGFSTPQLALTYAAEAAIPLFILGLFAVQRPRIGALGLVGAVTYAYTLVFFTSTVVYALVNHTHDWEELTTELGAWVTVHSVLMVPGRSRVRRSGHPSKRAATVDRYHPHRRHDPDGRHRQPAGRTANDVGRCPRPGVRRDGCGRVATRRQTVPRGEATTRAGTSAI